MEVIRINNLNNAEELLYDHNREIGRTMPENELRAGIQKFIKNGEILGYIVADRIIAMLNLYCNNYDTLSAYICNVYVLEEYRGKHYSENLLNKAVQICRERNFKNVCLHVSVENTPAVHIYKKMGFRFTGEKNSANDYEMKLDLNNETVYKKRLMILGAGNAQLNLILEAKKLGYFVIVCDNRPTMAGSIIADKYYQIDYMQKEKVIAIASNEQLDGITSSSEPVMPIVAEVSQLLHLPGNTVESIETLISKSKFRDLQNKVGVFAPEHYEVETVEELLDKAQHIHYPVIVKPAESCGTQGTTRLDTYDETLLRNAYEICREFSRNNLVTLEQYVPMNVLRVNDIDVFIVGDEIIWDGWLWEDRAAREPMLPMTEIFPMNLPKDQIRKIKETLEKLIRGAGITLGEYNVETYFTESGDVFVIEMNPRQAGNYIPQLIEQHTGVNLSKLLVSTAVNDMEYFEFLKTYERTNHYVTLQVVFSEKPGILRSLYIDPEIAKYVLWVDQVIECGSVVRRGINGFDAIAFVNMQFEDYETQHKFTDQIETYIYPVVE